MIAFLGAGIRSRGWWLTLGVVAAFFCDGCNRRPLSRGRAGPSANDSEAPPTTPVNAPSTASTPIKSTVRAAPQSLQPKPPASGPADLWRQFSGDRAFAEVRRQVEVGPRPSGSKEIEASRTLIEESLRRSGWAIERQEFTDVTPRGKMPFVNIIGRFGTTLPSAQQAIVCSHYDTKRFSTIQFVGASDGASSTGALLELARVLAMDPALASKIELVFFDGEEALEQFTLTDGLYGSRYYATKLRDANRAAQFRFAILWDMIGDKDLTITLSQDSPKDLVREILIAAEMLKLRQHFGYFARGTIYDDHVPLQQIARINAIDLIDFDYPAWHTADDKLDRLSPDSLQKVGAVTLMHLGRALAR